MVDGIIMCAVGLLLILLGIFFERMPVRMFTFTYVPRDADMDSAKMKRKVAQTKTILLATGFAVVLLSVAGMVFSLFGLRLFVPLWVAMLGGLSLYAVWLRDAPRKVKAMGWIAAAVGTGILLSLSLVLGRSGKTEMRVEAGRIFIEGMYSLEFPLTDVDTVYLSPEAPRTPLRTNGLSMNGIRKGYFRLESRGRCYLNTDARIPSYLYILRKGEMPVIVNWQNSEKTEDLYRMLRERLLERQRE